MALEISSDELLAIHSVEEIDSSIPKIFDAIEATKTKNEDLLYIKKFIAMTASLFLYLRNALNSEYFRKFTVCNGQIRLNLLCPPKQDSYICQIIDSFMKVFVEKEDEIKEISLHLNYKNSKGIKFSEVLTYELGHINDRLAVKLSMNGDYSDTVIANLTKDSFHTVANTKAVLRRIDALCDRLVAIPENSNVKLSVE